MEVSCGCYLVVRNLHVTSQEFDRKSVNPASEVPEMAVIALTMCLCPFSEENAQPGLLA